MLLSWRLIRWFDEVCWLIFVHRLWFFRRLLKCKSFLVLSFGCRILLDWIQLFVLLLFCKLHVGLRALKLFGPSAFIITFEILIGIWVINLAFICFLFFIFNSKVIIKCFSSFTFLKIFKFLFSIFVGCLSNSMVWIVLTFLILWFKTRFYMGTLESWVFKIGLLE